MLKINQILPWLEIISDRPKLQFWVSAETDTETETLAETVAETES